MKMFCKSSGGKRRILTVALILMLQITVLFGTLFVAIANANPVFLYYPKHPPPKPFVKATWLDVNTSAIKSRNLTFMVTAREGSWIDSYGIPSGFWGDSVETDFEPNHVYTAALSPLQVWVDGDLWAELAWSTDIAVPVSLSGLSDGWHTVEVTVTASGSYVSQEKGGQHFGSATGSSGKISFMVDNSPPTISILSLNAKAYSTSDLPLTFHLSENATKIAYCQDGKENATISGNVTLTGLTDGNHNVTLYAWDTAGNIGTSETLLFNVEVPNPFPTLPVVTASAVSAVAVGAVLLVYRKKRRREVELQ